MSYLSWNKKIIKNFSEDNIEELYNQAYVFGRTEKGMLTQTRSLRINLKNFALSSENRRILRKTHNIKLNKDKLPYSKYSWQIGKLAKDFYEKKFGSKIFSANKIREIMSESQKNNFNIVFVYTKKGKKIGYCISLETKNIIHYSYPFYDLKNNNKNIGMGMMLKAINYAKEKNKNYIYLGSAQRPTDIYKLQFKGLEWFNGKIWKNNIPELKNILKKIK